MSQLFFRDNYGYSFDSKYVYVTSGGEAFYHIELVIDMFGYGMNPTSFLHSFYNKQSGLHQFLLKFGYTSLEIMGWVRGVKDKSVPTKALALIQHYEAVIERNTIAEALSVMLIMKNYEDRAKEITGWKPRHLLSKVEHAQEIISGDKQYVAAAYKEVINDNWVKLYGYVLFGRSCGDGTAIYAIFIDKLGEEFQKVYDQENPKIKGRIFRRKTFSTVVSEHREFSDCLTYYSIKINNIMNRVIDEYDISYHLKNNSCELGRLRRNARSKMHRIIRKELPTIQDIYLDYIGETNILKSSA
jgi:hypothetical protein